ncbi:uncharacterized protein LOC110861047 [Folsomia candida]|uniref:Secreted protein n=1 Tax=Folsomia candida TaxID=158441 RepID=A0A226D5W6_FOLCA|nr:uncharacterized protein LOC110861047 [Folsomia candida]OXA39646.1 hypothetical protein Fcan01_25551 [Folsomia candida]
MFIKVVCVFLVAVVITPRHVLGATQAYNCVRDGYFKINTADIPVYCPGTSTSATQTFCDYVLCSYYPSLGRFTRTFYTCPLDIDPLNLTKDENEFNEATQTCQPRAAATTPAPAPGGT